MKRHVFRAVVLSVALALVGGSGVGHTATPTCTHSDAHVNSVNGTVASDGAGCVLEPIITRSDAAPVYVNDADPDGLGPANIKGFSLTGTGGRLVAKITTAKRIPTNVTDLATEVRAPYAGVHVLVLFQSETLEEEQDTGAGTTGPQWRADNFHWFLAYGNTLSEGGAPNCQFGRYDEAGQLFSVFAQSADNVSQNYSCTNSLATKTITITVPYLATWATADATGAVTSRQLRLVRPGRQITNVKAFTWLDHELGLPDSPAAPVIGKGLIFGFTWYSDVVPSNGYDFGLIAGDPNSGGVPGPTCRRFIVVTVSQNPLYTGGPCYIQTPADAGTGMKGTPLKFTAV